MKPNLKKTKQKNKQANKFLNLLCLPIGNEIENQPFKLVANFLHLLDQIFSIVCHMTFLHAWYIPEVLAMIWIFAYLINNLCCLLKKNNDFLHEKSTTVPGAESQWILFPLPEVGKEWLLAHLWTIKHWGNLKIKERNINHKTASMPSCFALLWKDYTLTEIVYMLRNEV